MYCPVGRVQRSPYPLMRQVKHMESPVGEPALRQAAVLITHWNRRDIEAVVMLLAELETDEAHDMIVAMLMLRDKTDEEISQLMLRVPA